MLDVLLQTLENKHLSEDLEAVYFQFLLFAILYSLLDFFLVSGIRYGFTFFCALKELSPVDKGSHASKLAACYMVDDYELWSLLHLFLYVCSWINLLILNLYFLIYKMGITIVLTLRLL